MILYVEPVIQHWFLIASILAFEVNLSEQKSRGNSFGTTKSFQSAGKEPLMIEWENYFCNDPPERLSQSLAGSPSPCNICTEGKPGPGLNWAKMKANKVRSREHDRNPTQGTNRVSSVVCRHARIPGDEDSLWLLLPRRGLEEGEM